MAAVYKCKEETLYETRLRMAESRGKTGNYAPTQDTVLLALTKDHQ